MVIEGREVGSEANAAGQLRLDLGQSDILAVSKFAQNGGYHGIAAIYKILRRSSGQECYSE
jgi:hypothetical protein